MIRMVVAMTVGVIVTTFIIRSLSVEDYGTYTVLYALISYVGTFGSFGIPAVFQRYIPELYQKNEYALLKRLVFRGSVLRFLLSAATVVVVLLLHDPVGRLLNLDTFLDYFSIFALGIIFSLEATLLTRVLNSLFLHKYSVIASTFHTLFRGALIFILLQQGWGIRGVLWAEVVCWIAWTILLNVFYYLEFSRKHSAKGETKPPLLRYARYGVLSSFNEIGGTPLGVSTDFFIITAFLGPGAVALLRICGQNHKTVSKVPSAHAVDRCNQAHFFFQIRGKR